MRYYHVRIPLLPVKPYISIAVDITCQCIISEDFSHIFIGLISRLIVTGTELPFPFIGLLIETDLDSRAWTRIRGRLVKGSDPHSQLEQTSDHRDMDPQYYIVDQLVEITDTMATLQDAISGLGQRIDGH